MGVKWEGVSKVCVHTCVGLTAQSLGTLEKWFEQLLLKAVSLVHVTKIHNSHSLCPCLLVIHNYIHPCTCTLYVCVRGVDKED